MADAIKKGVAGIASKLKNVQAGLSFPDITNSTAPPQKSERKGTGRGKAALKVLSEFSIGKIMIVLGIIIAAIFSAISFGAFGGFLVIIGLLIVWMMMKSPNALGFVGSIVKGVAFAGVLVVVLFFLSVYTPFPPLLLLVVAGGFLFVFIAKVDAKAGMVSIIILIVLAPFAQTYASTLPEDSPIAKSVTSIEQKLAGNFNVFSPKRIYEQIQRDAKRQIALASGEYYTSRVDSGAKKQLGVFLDELKTTQKLATFFVGEPINFFTKLTARALDFNVVLKLTCNVDGILGKVTPEMEELFGSADATEDVSEVIDVDCVFSAEQTKDWSAGSRIAKISAWFDFVTRGYVTVYFMDKEKLKGLEQRNLLEQWKQSLPSRDFTSITTSGPVRVGMSVGSQPVGISPQDNAGPTLGMSFDNAGGGKIRKINGVDLYLPKGLFIKDVNGLVDVAQKISCAEIPDEKDCDDDAIEVYSITLPREGVELVSLRIHTLINDYGALVGSGATPVGKKIWAMVLYEYELEKDKSFSIRVPVTV